MSLSVDHKIKQAISYKEAGNAAFKAENYEEGIRLVALNYVISYPQLSFWKQLYIRYVCNDLINSLYRSRLKRSKQTR